MEDLNRHFFKENTQMASKYIHRCSTLTAIKTTTDTASTRQDEDYGRDDSTRAGEGEETWALCTALLGVEPGRHPGEQPGSFPGS